MMNVKANASHYVANHVGNMDMVWQEYGIVPFEESQNQSYGFFGFYRLILFGSKVMVRHIPNNNPTLEFLEK